MAQTQCIKVRLKEGKTEAFLRWATSLPGRMNEVRDALRTEGVIAETILLERSSAGDWIVFYTKAQSIVEANKAFERSNLPIDVEAKQVIADTWDLSSIKSLEVVVDL